MSVCLTGRVKGKQLIVQKRILPELHEYQL